MPYHAFQGRPARPSAWPSARRGRLHPPGGGDAPTATDKAWMNWGRDALQASRPCASLMPPVPDMDLERRLGRLGQVRGRTSGGRRGGGLARRGPPARISRRANLANFSTGDWSMFRRYVVDTCRRFNITGLAPKRCQSIPNDPVDVSWAPSRQFVDITRRFNVAGLALGGIESTCVPISPPRGVPIATSRGFERESLRNIAWKWTCGASIVASWGLDARI